MLGLYTTGPRITRIFYQIYPREAISVLAANIELQIYFFVYKIYRGNILFTNDYYFYSMR